MTGSTTLTVNAVSATVNQQVAALLVAVTGVGPGKTLSNSITAVQEALAVPNIATACTALGNFKVTVSSQSGKSITTVQADQFTADADAIGAGIPCP